MPWMWRGYAGSVPGYVPTIRRFRNDKAPTGPCGLADGIEDGGDRTRLRRVMHPAHHMRLPGAYPGSLSEAPTAAFLPLTLHIQANALDASPRLGMGRERLSRPYSLLSNAPWPPAPPYSPERARSGSLVGRPARPSGHGDLGVNFARARPVWGVRSRAQKSI